MIDLSDRKKALFEAIVREHVNTAKPIPSKVVVEKYGFDVSPATVRNDMMELEAMGLITQPHTSAGRIPTEAGYRYYIQTFLERERSLTGDAKSNLNQLAEIANGSEPEVFVKTMAKGMAQLASEAVLVSLNAHSFYYTGITNIARQPEFADSANVSTLSELIDHLDDVMAQLRTQLLTQLTNQDVQILIGEDNPVSQACSLLIMPYRQSNGVVGTVAILGPMRMQYQFNYQVLKHAQSVLNAPPSL